MTQHRQVMVFACSDVSHMKLHSPLKAVFDAQVCKHSRCAVWLG